MPTHSVGKFINRPGGIKHLIRKREAGGGMPVGKIRRQFAVSQKAGDDHAFQHAARTNGMSGERLEQVERGFLIDE